MGFVGSLVWANSYSKKHCRSLFWKMRLAVKKAVKSGSKQKFQFQYDPSSYALNFDDGLNNMGEEANAFHKAKFHSFPETTYWVYVIQ
ncbi:Late endosome and vacuole interface protein, partial [Actinidia chinensis var. chinensis]